MNATPQNPWLGRAGILVSAIPVAMLLMSAGMKFSGGAEMVEMFVSHLGFPATTLTPIGIAELASTLLYIIPQTAVLGAVLLTGYLGGAITAHLRLGEPVLTPLALGVLVWAGLYLRDARIRALLPLRR